MYDPAMFATLSVALILVVSLLYVAYLYREIVSRYNDLSNQNIKLQKNAEAEADRLKQNAILESRKILETAVISAKKIITDTEFISKSTKHEFSKSLNETLDTELEVAKATLSAAAVNTSNATENISEDTRRFAETIIAQFQKVLEEQSSQVVNEFVEISKVAKEGVDKELLAYKKAKMENLDELALKTAQDIAKTILGKTLTYEEHEKMVLEALAEAKEKHII